MQSISVFLDISKFSGFRWKKFWCQQNSRGVSRDSYFCLIFFRHGMPVPSFIIVGYVRQTLDKWAFLGPPHQWAAPKKPILNRVKLLTRLQLGFSQLRQHKLRHNFKGTMNTLCCSIKPETKRHFFLGCQSKCNLGKSYEWPRIL